MGFFFRKRVKILPGLYMNLSKGGVGFSAGVKGCRVSVNPKGETYLNAGSNGFYIREKISDSNEQLQPSEQIETISNSEEIQDMVKMSTARAKSYFLKIQALDKLNLEGIINDSECENMKKQIEGGNPQETNSAEETSGKDDALLAATVIGFVLLFLILFAIFG